MGVMFDYFAAPSDEAAAALIQSGPADPMEPSPALQQALRTGDHAAMRLAMRPVVRESAAGVLSLSTKGIDPVVQMATLEELVTGVDYDAIVERPRSGHILAEVDDGEVLVVALTDELEAALAAATVDELVATASPWSQTEEFDGHGDVEALAHFLLALADLARQATLRRERLYCWVCV